MPCLYYTFGKSWRNYYNTVLTSSQRCVPESPRWLMAVGKRKEALSVLENAAITNGLNPDTVKTSLGHFSSLPNIKERPKFSSLFVEKNLRIRTLLMWINW